MEEKRGSIGFFATYRPPVPLDIYSSPYPFPLGSDSAHDHDELLMTDGKSYNYNAQFIPPAALKTILSRPVLASEATPEDVDSGDVSGMVFVSERTQSLETLHIALRVNGSSPHVKVFNFAEVYDEMCTGPRLEDSGSIAGDYLVYVSTKDNPHRPREPWTAVYKTNLIDGKTDRLTPPGVADFNPSVSPSGRKIAVASLQFKEEGWDGEIEYLKTDIIVMNIDEPLNRKVVIKNGGWPTWGSNDVLFFHRKVGKKWGVFRADVTNGFTRNASRVTPDNIDAITPAAIDTTTVAVATIREKLGLSTETRQKPENYRHIEVFDSSQPQHELARITQETLPLADHYNPSVMVDDNGRTRIVYHRCNQDQLKIGDVSRKFNKVQSPDSEIGVFRVSGVFPTFSTDGKKLAFVDNEFKNVWLADEKGLRTIHTTQGPDNVFAPVWNQDPEKDTLYICMGPSFHANDVVTICAIFDASSGRQQFQELNKGGFNNAFPSSNPDGTRLVFRSTRAGRDEKGNIFKNLYITDAELGEYGFGSNKLTRLTEGPWVDSHCQWSPSGDWIVFSSTRDKPKHAVKRDDLPDGGYYGLYLVNANNPDSWVRVLGSGSDLDYIPGHVNHPFFSPDGKSIVFASDIAAVSVDPISLPLFIHSVRPYGDIFTVDINTEDITKNENIKEFNRITHSRYENSTPSWTMFDTHNPIAAWNIILDNVDGNAPRCPLAHPSGGESWLMTGHLCIPKRCC